MIHEVQQHVVALQVRSAALNAMKNIWHSIDLSGLFLGSPRNESAAHRHLDARDQGQVGSAHGPDSQLYSWDLHIFGH